MKTLILKFYKDNIVFIISKALIGLLVILLNTIFITDKSAAILESVINGNQATLMSNIYSFIGIAFICIIFQAINLFISYKINIKCKNSFEDLILEHVSSLSSWEQNCLSTNDLFVRIVKNLNNVSAGTINIFFDLYSIIISIISALIYSFCVDAICTTISLIMVFVTFFISKKNFMVLRSVKKSISNTHNKTYGFVWQVITNKEILKFLNIKRLIAHDENNVEENLSLHKQIGKINAVNSLIQKLNSTGVILIISLSIAVCIFLKEDYISITNIFILFIIIPKVSTSFFSLFGWYSSLATWTSEVQLIDDIMIKKKYNYNADLIDISSINNLGFVNLTIKVGEKCILKNFSNQFYAQDFIGIIGKSGRGKSTLLKSCLGLFNSYDGHIFYNDIDLSNINRKSIWKCAGYLPQKGVIINGTILNNIVFESDVNLRKLHDILECVELTFFIDSLKYGIHTDVSNLNMSSGERQKLLLARILYTNQYDIYLFDEPVSAIDPGTQKRIINKIKNFIKENNKISLWVTHNRELINVFDKIIDLDCEADND